MIGIYRITRKKQDFQRLFKQYSALEPDLFPLFTADHPSYVGQFSKAVMFADDTILITSDKSTETLEIENYIAVNLAQGEKNNIDAL